MNTVITTNAVLDEKRLSDGSIAYDVVLEHNGLDCRLRFECLDGPSARALMNTLNEIDIVVQR